MVKVVKQTCRECEIEFEWERKKHNGLCLDCSVKKMMTVIEQLNKQEGPYYEKWLDSCNKAVKNYARSHSKAVAHYRRALEMMAHEATPVGQAEKLLIQDRLDKEFKGF